MYDRSTISNCCSFYCRKNWLDHRRLKSNDKFRKVLPIHTLYMRNRIHKMHKVFDKQNRRWYTLNLVLAQEQFITMSNKCKNNLWNYYELKLQHYLAFLYSMWWLEICPKQFILTVKHDTKNDDVMTRITQNRTRKTQNHIAKYAYK